MALPSRPKSVHLFGLVNKSSNEEASKPNYFRMEPSSDGSVPYPNTQAVFCGGLSKYFQGEPRNNSPFLLPDENLMTISKTAVFNALREGGRKLSLRVGVARCFEQLFGLSVSVIFGIFAISVVCSPIIV